MHVSIGGQYSQRRTDLSLRNDVEGVSPRPLADDALPVLIMHLENMTVTAIETNNNNNNNNNNNRRNDSF